MTPWENKPQPPFSDHLGFQVLEWENNHVVVSAETRPEYCNNSGIPHGGFISSLIDVATALAGVYCPNPTHIRRALTLSLNIHFMGQAQSRSLRAVGKVTRSGSKIFYATAEVYDSEGTYLASGQAVCRYRSGSEGPEGEPFLRGG